MRSYLACSPRTRRTAIFVFLICLFFAGLSALQEYQSDTVHLGYIDRAEAGGDPAEKTLRAKSAGEAYDLPLTVRPRVLSKEEVSALLDEAETALPGLLFGEMPLTHIDRDLSLPAALMDDLVRLVFTSSRPEVLSYDGTLGPDLSEEGTQVTLSADLLAQSEIRTVSYSLTVYPAVRTPEETFRGAVQEVLDREDPSSARVLLPDSVNGNPVVWESQKSSTPLFLLLLGPLMAVLVIAAEKSRLCKAAEKADEALTADYPKVATKLSLLLCAGLSSRTAVKRIALDYAARRDAGGSVRPGYEEFVSMYYEMNRGATEIDAYRSMGRRVRNPLYKSLSAMLTQNLTKGSRTLLAVLDKEARGARAERREKTRVLGEKASLKLLLPMVAHLSIVLLVMIVPAFMTII